LCFYRLAENKTATESQEVIVKTDFNFNYEDGSVKLVDHTAESIVGQNESNRLQEETNIGESDPVKLHFKSKKYV